MRSIKGRPVVAIVLLFATALIVAAKPKEAIQPEPATVASFEPSDLNIVAAWLRNYPKEAIMVTGGSVDQVAKIAISIENLGINPARVSIQVVSEYGDTVTIRER